ncbi:MAG: hypothetical protein A2W33_10790 [Chloroflexi bacterium RBG_16_52_11]|nr:MAG: hypothetical protein A2W33_10790 [Chloroflexi bacterium RBG_16_52_11]
MKRFLICALVMITLAACADGSSLYRHNCSEGGEVCIELQAEEPIVNGEPVIITITVTSEKDIPDLKIFLYSFPKTQIEDIDGWNDDGVNWVIDTKANRSYTFTRKVLLSSKEGLFDVIAEVYTPSLHTADMISILLTDDGGKVYHSGTPIPITEGPVPLFTGPSPTFEPTRTRPIFPTAVSTTEAPPLEVLGTPAYPPPGTPYP